MKKISRIIKSIALIVFMFTIAGCSTGNEASNNDKSSYKIGMIPKFTGVDYFIAVENGAKKAAKDLGVTLDWQGDASGQQSAAKQQAYIQTFIDKEYDAILVSALDSTSYAETLKQARGKGIKIITWDADVEKDARDYFVNQIVDKEIGTAMMQSIAADLDGQTGKIVIVSSDPNSTNQNAWIDAIETEYKRGDYGNLTMHNEIIYAGNNQAEADSKVNTLLIQNPDIKGIFALSSIAVPSTSKAIKDLNLEVGSIAIAGLGIPVTAKADMEAGVFKSVILWQPYDLGYLAVEFTNSLLKGEVSSSAVNYKSSLSGASQCDTKLYADSHTITDDNQVILGDPVIYTLDLVDYFKGYPNADSGLK